MNISATSKPITQFYLKYHWGVEKASLGFNSDRIRTLVSMATDSTHRGIAFIFDWIFFIIVGYKDNNNISDKFEFRPELTRDCGVSYP